MAQQQHTFIVDNAHRFSNLASTKPGGNQIYPRSAEMAREANHTGLPRYIQLESFNNGAGGNAAGGVWLSEGVAYSRR